MPCFLGHQWDGCRCKKCGKMRDEDHRFELVAGQCKKMCAVCDKLEETPHQYKPLPDQCLEQCTLCGQTHSGNHPWRYAKDHKTCARCGVVEKLEADESLGAEFLLELRAHYPHIVCEDAAVPLLGRVSTLNIMLMTFASSGYNPPFASLWSGTYVEEEFHAYLAGKTFYMSSQEDARNWLMLQLDAFSCVKTALETYTDAAYLLLIEKIALEENAQTLRDSVAKLLPAQKIEVGKELFRAAYERQVLQKVDSPT